MSRHDIEYLLDRYLKKETTAHENEVVENWLAENNNENNEWQRLDETDRSRWLNNLFSDIKNTIDAGDEKVVPMYTKRTWWRGIAAAAAVLVIFSALLFEWEHARHDRETLTVSTAAPKAKQEISLADGSQVWVNAGAVLKYPKSFAGKTREVYLAGEAYFDVVHNAAQPFIVHTGSVVTTVLGTAFDIKAGKNSNTIVVTVTRGKVSVMAGKRLLGFVTPNRQITYNTVNHEQTESTVDADKVIAWQQNDLHFDDVTFENAALQLEQHFNIRISFSNDKVKACRFSGTSFKGKTLDQVLTVICAFNNASFKHLADGSIMIDGKGCN